MDRAKLRSLFELSGRGPVFLVQEALPHLKHSRHAAVLNVVSGAAFLFSATISLYAIGIITGQVLFADGGMVPR